MESQSKIRKSQSDVDHGLREYNKVMTEAVRYLKEALKENNENRARVFAEQIKNLDSVIKGLQDYKLYLGAIELSLRYNRTQHEIMNTLSNGAKDLQNSLPTEKQLLKIQEEMQTIANSSDRAIDILTNQLDQVSQSVYDKTRIGDDDVNKIIESFKQVVSKEQESSGGSETTQDKEIDDLIKRLTK